MENPQNCIFLGYEYKSVFTGCSMKYICLKIHSRYTMKFMNSLEEFESIYMMMPKKFQFEFLLLRAEKGERNYGKITPGDENSTWAFSLCVEMFKRDE